MASGKGLDKVIELATQIGVKVAIDYIHREKDARRKSRFDRRMRNTKLLLREYRKLIIHSHDAVYQQDESPIDVLDELDSFEYSDNLYIESIKRSKERTALIINHVNKMLEIYKTLCERSQKPEDIRRYNTLYDMYISDEQLTAQQIADKYVIEIRSVYRDIDKAAETLSAMIFGIDGLKID